MNAYPSIGIRYYQPRIAASSVGFQTWEVGGGLGLAAGEPKL
jgi:hypothetical protein